MIPTVGKPTLSSDFFLFIFYKINLKSKLGNLILNYWKSIAFKISIKDWISYEIKKIPKEDFEDKNI